MSVAPEYSLEGAQTDRPDFYAIADHMLVGEVPADGACGQLAELERRLLRPVWGGDSEEPVLVERARKICLACPVLESCRRYATDNLVEHGFLAGQTAGERSTAWTRQNRVALRRRKVRKLYQAGATVIEMIDVLSTPRRTIEADIATLRLSGSRRRNRVAS
jgi:Transcription factor WhiB